ncbi:MAG: TusE/DsrC/DsvC family sulfur relay protein [Chromatiales bacterium]|nr:TusE/DsrC/DsvC family sulfur relay protein [Chromatiales bacterium]
MHLAKSNDYRDQHNLLAVTPFDDEGFLLDPAEWSEEVAVILAEMEGVGELTAEHWAVIKVLRDLYLRLGALPPMRRICRNSAVSRTRVKELFGGCRQVWRIAGLPHPGEEALTYMA